MKLSFIYFIIFLSTVELSGQNWDLNMLDKVNSNENQCKDVCYMILSRTVAPASITFPISMLAAGDYYNDPAKMKSAYFVGASILAASLLTTTIKYSFKRQRPFEENLCITKKCNVGKLSFPSGHTSSAFAIATALSLAYPQWYIIAPSILWASSVAYSRMYLGVHYPTDVLGGMVIGIGVSCILWEVEKRINK